MNWYVADVVATEDGGFTPGAEGKPWSGTFQAHCHEPKDAPSSALVGVPSGTSVPAAWEAMTLEQARAYFVVHYGCTDEVAARIVR